MCVGCSNSDVRDHHVNLFPRNQLQKFRSIRCVLVPCRVLWCEPFGANDNETVTHEAVWLQKSLLKWGYSDRSVYKIKFCSVLVCKNTAYFMDVYINLRGAGVAQSV
jgi:hypothetical protein